MNQTQAATPPRRAVASLRNKLRTGYAVPVLAVLLFGVAMHLGGAPAVAIPLWASIAASALLFTGIDPTAVTRDRVIWAISILLGVSAVQLIPLPPWLLLFLDRRSAEISAGALSPLRIDRTDAWRPLHLDPGNGWSDVHYLVGLSAAYLASKHVVRRGHGESLTGIAAVSALFIAVLGLAHKGVDLEKLYGFYVPTQATPPILAPILNGNHLAAFTGAGAILWLARSMESLNPAARMASGAAAALCTAVCALTLSKGGVAATLGGLILLAGLESALNSHSTDRRRSSPIPVRAVLGLSGLVGIGVYVAWSALRTEYLAGDVSKLRMFWMELGLVSQHPMLGVGAGGVHVAVTSSGALSEWIMVERAESLPIDLALAVGPVPALIVMALLLRWLWSVRPTRRSLKPDVLGAFCALASIIAHDLVDFSLWLGATGYLAAILAGILSAQRDLGLDPLVVSRRGRHRRAIALLCVLSVIGGFVTASSPVYLDHDRAATAAGIGALPDRELRAMFLRHPGDAFLPYAGAAAALRSRDPRVLRFVNRAMLLGPSWSMPHAMLARVLIARGLRSQAIVELRYAASTGGVSHNVIANILIGLSPTDEEVVRALPAGETGLALLRVIVAMQWTTPFGTRMDALLRSRAPDDVDAIGREVIRAHQAGDARRERSLLERLIRLRSREPSGYVGLATLLVQEGDVRGAEAKIREGLALAGGDTTPYLMGLADIQARTRDVAAMRRTMQEIQDLAGADLDRRIRALAHLAGLEASLGNPAAALAAYERADGMSLPEHPYLPGVIEMARQLNDVPRLRGACLTLMEQGEPSDAQRATCAAVVRTPPTSM